MLRREVAIVHVEPAPKDPDVEWSGGFGWGVVYGLVFGVLAALIGLSP